MIDLRTEEGERLAVAEIAARAEIKQRSARAGNRTDPNDPATRAWHDAIAHWHLALRRVYPDEFWKAIAALKQTRHRDAATGEWVWDTAPAASVEAAIRFLEADLVCFRSGYVKERLVRHLIRQPLGDDALRRLREVVLAALDGPARREFRAFCRLAARVCDDALLARLEAAAEGDDPGVARRAGWIRVAITSGQSNGRGRQRPGARL